MFEASTGYTDNVQSTPKDLPPGVASPQPDLFGVLSPGAVYAIEKPSQLHRFAYTYSLNLFFRESDATSSTNRSEYTSLFEHLRALAARARSERLQAHHHTAGTVMSSANNLTAAAIPGTAPFWEYRWKRDFSGSRARLAGDAGYGVCPVHADPQRDRCAGHVCAERATRARSTLRMERDRRRSSSRVRVRGRRDRRSRGAARRSGAGRRHRPITLAARLGPVVFQPRRGRRHAGLAAEHRKALPRSDVALWALAYAREDAERRSNTPTS